MKRRAGFTLLELILIMSLGMILAGVGIAGFLRNSREQAVTAAAERLRQAFSQAKANSLSGKKDCAVCRCEDVNPLDDVPLRGWRVTVETAGPLGFTVQGECALPSAPTPSPFLVRREDFPAQVVEVTAMGNSVLFLSLNEGIEPAGGATFNLVGAGVTRTVSVGANGEIE